MNMEKMKVEIEKAKEKAKELGLDAYFNSLEIEDAYFSRDMRTLKIVEGENVRVSETGRNIFVNDVRKPAWALIEDDLGIQFFVYFGLTYKVVLFVR